MDNLGNDQDSQRAFDDALHDTAAALSSTLDFDVALDRILLNVGHVIECDMLAVMLIEQDIARVIRCQSEKFSASACLGQRVNIAETRHWRSAVETHQPILIADTQAYANWVSLPEMSWSRSHICAPISTGGQVAGLLTLDNAAPNSLTDLDAVRLRALADQAAIALNNARIYAQIDRRADEFAALYSIAGELATQRDLQTLLQAIVEHATRLVGVPAGGIYLYDATRNDLEMVTVKGVSSLLKTRLRLGEGMAGRVAQTLKPLIVGDYQTWEHRMPQHQQMPLRSTLQVPMIYGGELIGVLSVTDTAKANQFTEADAQLLSLLAVQAASAVRNARLIEQTQVRADQLALLYEAGLALNSERDPHAQLELLITLAARALRADHAEFFRYDPMRQILQTEVGIGYDERTRAALQELTLALHSERGFISRVARERKPLNMPDVLADPNWIVVDPELRSGLWVPVERNERLLGVLGVLSTRVNAFEPHDERLLVMFANQAAISLENARLFQAEQRQREMAETLQQVGAALVSTLDTDTVLERLLERLDRVIPYDTANVLLIEGESVRLVRGRGYAEQGVQMIRVPPYPVTSRSNLRQMLESRQPLAIPDVRDDPNWVHRSTDLQRSYAGAPICVRGQVTGFLNVGSNTPGFFHEADATRLQAFADQAGIALENARLYQAEREQFRRLQASQAQLVQAEKMAALGRLVASIAHEINNPLQAVQGCLALIQEELQGSRRQERIERFVGMAESEVERLTGIVRRVREFYRPVNQEWRATDVRATLESVLALTGKQLQNSRITVEPDWAADLPPIQANPDYLRQVFLNLVINAMDAMAQSGGTLSIRTALDQVQPPHGDHPVPAVRIEIRDTGQGIPPDVLPHIFEPFFTGKKNGTGLGLSISYGIVEAHNGRIEATSQVEHGTAFTIWLPVGET